MNFFSQAWPRTRPCLLKRCLRAGVIMLRHMRHHRVVPFMVFTLLVAGCAGHTDKPRESVNSLGMTLVRIPPGSFEMGVDSVPLPPELTKGVSGASWDRPDGNGDYDEVPVHRVVGALTWSRE